MTKIIMSLFLAGILSPCLHSQVPPKEAKLTVNMSDMKSTGLYVEYDGQLSLIDRNYKQYPIRPDRTGYCEITAPLESSQYFTILRNPIYLSPGDHLTIRLNENPNLTRIEGVGAEVNTYLKKKYYAKGGSFLNAGDPAVMRPALEEQLIILDSMADARRKELDLLKAGDAFKELENIRIKADYVNSLVYYPTYNPTLFGENTREMTKEAYQARRDEYFIKIKPYIRPLLEEMASDDKYLDIEVVRLTLARFSRMEGYGVKTSEHFGELSKIADYSFGIRGSISKKQYDELFAFGKTIKSADYRSIYMNKLERHTKFIEGRSAIDFEVTDPKGNRKKLSDYKGKVMYVDIWATWCGPCRMQAPVFKQLSEKYPNIHFISLSVDENKAAWDKEMKNKAHDKITELWAEPDMRKKWEILMIPRFLLIDKDFNIIYAEAPRPSDTKYIEPLLEEYNRF